MSTVIVPKRKRRTKRKPKHSFDPQRLISSTSSGPAEVSRGPNNKPSNIETSLLELLVHFRMQQESHYGKRQSSEVRNACQRVDSKCHSRDKNSTPSRTMSNYKGKVLGKSNISSSTSDEGEYEFKVDEKPRLTKQGALDILTHLRDFLRENGPSEEYELRKAVSISEVQKILDIHGTITAFLVPFPIFEVIHEYLYTFVYYNCSDGEEDRLAETFTELLNDGILQDAIAGDGVRQGKRLLSSNSSFGLSTGGGGDNEPATCRTMNASSQISSRHLHHSCALKVLRQTCDDKVQRKSFQPAQITELKSGLQKCHAKITQLKQKSNAIPERQERKPQQIHDNIRTVERTSPPPNLVPPSTAAKVNSVSTSKKDGKSRSTHEPGAQESSREPKPRPFSNPSTQHQPKAEQKALVIPVHQTPSFMSLIRGITPSRYRQMFEKEHGFSYAPNPRPRLTPRRRHSPLPPKTEKSRARRTPPTPQPVYPQRRSTRSTAEQRPYSIPIGQNTLLKPQPRPRSPPESRQKHSKSFSRFLLYQGRSYHVRGVEGYHRYLPQPE
ncbi:hypothetical protein HPB51_023489 [Rhipicephalus microplus]|uniref:Uncharacterized protein n=1 Tax=Rhipicephalus microplus TaxID=6941 RepID=A0A9J6EJC7_RHIMP|nr:hypothetical protein HPB51_023489 [Rhipicephalus microplus]